MSWSILLLMAKGALLTLEISFLGIALGLIGGTVLGTCNCRKLNIFPFAHLIRAYVSVIRGTPLFVQILIIYFGVPALTDVNFSPLVAGVIALGLNSAAYLAETVRGGINAIEESQWEAAKTLGYSTPQTLRFVILPQAFTQTLPPLANELVTLIKESSILMVVGVPELTKVSKDIVARELKPMEIYLVCAAFYFAMTSALSWFCKQLERKNHAF